MGTLGFLLRPPVHRREVPTELGDTPFGLGPAVQEVAPPIR